MIMIMNAATTKQMQVRVQNTPCTIMIMLERDGWKERGMERVGERERILLAGAIQCTSSYGYYVAANQAWFIENSKKVCIVKE